MEGIFYIRNTLEDLNRILQAQKYDFVFVKI